MGDPVGIIYPSSEDKVIIDRTATYVAKNGSAFEERIKQDQKGKPKFDFLLPGDPLNAYYRHKVNEIKSSLLRSDKAKESRDDHQSTVAPHDDNSSERAGENRDAVSNGSHHPHGDEKHHNQDEDSTQRGANSEEQEEISNEKDQMQVKSNLEKFIQEKTAKLVKPPSLNFLASPVSITTHLECDIIKLTSQFISTFGRPFLLELVSREQSNSLFDFLKPQHGQFSYMTNLVMQYALIQNPPLDILEDLKKDATCQSHVLEKIRMRAEWNRMLEIEKRKREEAEEREKELYNQIDWHDFVIVETVDYQPGDKGEYPPTTADHVGTRMLRQQRLEDHNIPEEMEIDMDVESDQESDDDRDNNDGFAIPQPPDATKINIRKDYDPKAASKPNPTSENYFISPITNERIPVDRIHDHVRYNLADPRYLEKKEQNMQNKINEETVFASGSQIQSSLKNLAERRTDIFGMNDAETAIGQRIGEEEEEQAKKDDKIIWDGHKSSLKKKKLN